jgi:hypothetical protein
MCVCVCVCVCVRACVRACVQCHSQHSMCKSVWRLESWRVSKRSGHHHHHHHHHLAARSGSLRAVRCVSASGMPAWCYPDSYLAKKYTISNYPVLQGEGLGQHTVWSTVGVAPAAQDSTNRLAILSLSLGHLLGCRLSNALQRRLCACYGSHAP